MKNDLTANLITNTIITPLLAYFIPISDTSIRISLSMLISYIFTTYQKQIFNFFNITFGYNFVRIKPENQLYDTITDYISTTHNTHIKNCHLIHKQGTHKVNITELHKTITIPSFGTIPGTTSNPGSPVHINIENPKDSETDIIFSSKLPISKIEQTIHSLVKLKQSSETSNITIYKLSHTTKKKNKQFSWNQTTCFTNKTLLNTFFPTDIITNFFEKFEQFSKSEPIYNKKGLNYKQTFLLHGEPGCGKTSAIKILAAMHNLPIFIVDLDRFKNNSDFESATSDIKLHTNNSKHIILFEDVDRCSFFTYNRDNTVTQNIFLNFLDGVEDSHNRIVIITANNANVLDKCKGFTRPGRIDKIIHFTFCTKEQIIQTINHYFETQIDQNIDPSPNIPACNLMQTIEQTRSLPDVLTFISNPNTTSNISNPTTASTRKLSGHSSRRRRQDLLTTAIKINKITNKKTIDETIETLKLKQQIELAQQQLLKKRYDEMKSKADPADVAKIDKIIQDKLTDNFAIDRIMNPEDNDGDGNDDNAGGDFCDDGIESCDDD